MPGRDQARSGDAASITVDTRNSRSCRRSPPPARACAKPAAYPGPSDGRAHEVKPMDQFDVVVGTGSFRSNDAKAIQFPHRWTSEGVTVEAAFSGAHLLHLAVAGCVLNDIYREAATLGIQIDGVRVSAAGGFDTKAWTSTGITYSVELLSPASAQDRAQLLDRADDAAEIPRAIRAGAMVQRG